MSYEVTSTAVIHELLDNEIIIANLDTGSYYSLRGSGIPIWQLLISGHDLASITSIFKQKFHLDITEQLLSFIDLLMKESLIVAISPNGIANVLPPNLVWPSEYSPPSLEKYEEMKNLLMLDPVHEVDEQGWPSKS